MQARHSAGKKVIVFTCFQEGITKHKKALGEVAVTITGSDNMEQRQGAVDRFQTDPSVTVALCNLIAGGVGITLTAGTHVIFQDLDWVPANHLQAEDRAYRMGQKELVTVEYFVADGTLDGYIGTLMENKLALISAVESDQLPDSSLLNELYANLAKLAPALMQENKALATEGDAAKRIEQLALSVPKPESKSPIAETGMWEFPSSRDPKKLYRVTFGRAGHLDCTCEGFGWRGECSHVRKVIRCAVAQRRMRPLSVVKGEVPGHLQLGFGDTLVGMEINVFVLDALPYPLDKGFVEPAAFAVHADPDAVGLEDVSELGTVELAALVGVQDLQPTLLANRFIQRLDAEVRAHAYRYPVSQYFARGSIKNDKR